MEQSLYNLRHSLSHVLAQAVQRSLDPRAQLGTWPAVDNWFYYDIKLSEWVEFGEENLKDLTKVMQGIVKEGQLFGHVTITSLDDALTLCNLMWQKFKVELLTKFAAKGITEYTFYYNYVDAQMLPRLEKNCDPKYLAQYQQLTEYINIPSIFVTFLDLCEWWHVESFKDIPDGCFTLDKIAGAYRQWDENNPQMTRIYGLAFETKDELKDYQHMMEEARKRDHRVIGQKMQLFAFDEEVWPGLPLWLPNGAILVEELELLAKQKEREYGYSRVRSPHIAKDKLYLRSWHLPYYEEDMFPPMDLDGEKYYLKAMNCPHHHKIFWAIPKSYRDMPVRYAEYGHCYRYEDSGSLMWLMRVRSMCMNDAHIYCTEDQFEEEFIKVIELYLFYFKLFGVEKYQMRLSKHSKEGLGKKYVDNEALWIKTEEQVRSALIATWVPFVEAENEGAFYGPKIDVQIRSVIGREFTLATNQLDFAVPERFNLQYIDANGEYKTPLCIHRAPLSTHERMIGFLIEHFAGNFPLWLTPEQVRLIPVIDNEIVSSHVAIVQQALQSADIRVHIDNSDDSFAKKVRNAETDKVYYALIIGEQEATDGTVSIRNVRTKEQSVVKLEDFVQMVKEEIVSREL